MANEHYLFTNRDIRVEPLSSWTGVVSGETDKILVSVSFPEGPASGTVYHTFNEHTQVLKVIEGEIPDTLFWEEWTPSTITESTLDKFAICEFPPSALRFVNLDSTNAVVFSFRGHR